MNLKELSMGASLLSAVCIVGAGCGASSSSNDAGGCGDDASHAPDTGDSTPDTGTEGDATPPPLGDASPADGGAFAPSNVPLPDFATTQDITITASACAIDTDKLTIDCVPKGADGGVPYVFVSAMQSDSSQVSVLAVKSLTVNPSAQVTVQGSVPLILLALTSVNIQGSVDAEPAFGASNGGGPLQTLSGAGGGAGGGTAASGGSYIAGGGGGFCGVGGSGANSVLDGGAAAGGRSYGSATLVPLVAGSSGGGQGAGHEGGRGGGAIQISAGQSIVVGTSGVLDVPGSGASGNGGGGGTRGIDKNWMIRDSH